jgi:acetyl esterase/lipase
MRRTLSALLVAVTVTVLAGCDLHQIAPTGDAPMRYRDEVFAQVETTTAVPYGSAVTQQGQTQTLLLDVYEPVGDTVEDRPAIIWIHGGGFRFGSRTSPEIVDQAQTFARKGFVSVSISYRLSTNGCFPVSAECLTAIVDARHDAQAAVRFLRANADTYDIDTSRIAVAGTSAGAITALNVAYSPEDPGASGNPGYPSDVRAAVSLSGARILSTPNAGEPPVLLFHGTADTLVPYSAAVNTVDSARAAGLLASITAWEGQGHVPWTANRTQILDETTNFLYWFLDLMHAAT